MTCVSTNTNTTQLTYYHPQQTHNSYPYDALQQIDALTQPQKPWSAATFRSLLTSAHHHLLYITITQVNKQEQFSIIKQTNLSKTKPKQELKKTHWEITPTIQKESRLIIVGFCLYQQLFETAEILRIATHPLYQRQGIGNQMLIALFDKLTQQQAQHILLEVRADNAAAIGLYQQHGFVQIDTRKGYYSPTRQPVTQQNQHQFEVQPRVDALIMQKMLST